MVIIFHNITVLLYFDQINAALVSKRDLFKKKKNIWIVVCFLFVFYLFA